MYLGSKSLSKHVKVKAFNSFVFFFLVSGSR